MGRSWPHVDPHLVQQGDGADRETEVEQGAVQYLHRLPFQHQARRLVHVGRQDAVDVETRLVLHDDGVLPWARANARVVATVSALVPAWGMISASGILSTGLK